MNKYKIILTRDLTESCFVEVEAANEEEAEDKARAAALCCETEWETDEGNCPGRAYITLLEKQQ